MHVGYLSMCSSVYTEVCICCESLKLKVSYATAETCQHQCACRNTHVTCNNRISNMFLQTRPNFTKLPLISDSEIASKGIPIAVFGSKKAFVVYVLCNSVTQPIVSYVSF